MDDGDSHPASESNNQMHWEFLKHNLRPFPAAGYVFLCFGGWFYPRN